MPSLGQRLAGLRAERRQTLRAVAESTGLAESFLSKLEHDKVNVSVTNLRKLAAHFGVGLGSLFAAATAGPVARVVRARSRLRVHHGAELPRLELAAPLHGAVQAIVISTQPETPVHSVDWTELGGQTGDCLQLVLAGRVRLAVGPEEYLLETGDSLVHPAGATFDWCPLDDRPATVLLVRCGRA